MVERLVGRPKTPPREDTGWEPFGRAIGDAIRRRLEEDEAINRKPVDQKKDDSEARRASESNQFFSLRFG